MADPTPYSDRGPVDIPGNQSSGIEIKSNPLEERLRYHGGASNLHSKILSRLIARRRMSERAMNKRYDSWNQVDEHCRMFIDLTRNAKNGDGSRQSDKKEVPWARSIVVPMSYAILQVYLTQLMGIFTRRDPPLEITGVGAEDVKPAKLMNAVIGYDQVQTNYVLELYTALQDALKYGMGGFHDCWEEEFGYKTVRASGWTEKVLKMLGKPTSQRRWDKIQQFNSVKAYDPFSYFPDCRVSLSDSQKGEFVFHRLWRGYLEILSNSIENGGNYFNVEAVKMTSPKPQALRSRNRLQASQMNLIGSADERDRGFHAIDTGVVRIIPSEWELGDGDRPELWQFAWVDDTVIIRAHQFDYDHGKFNYSNLESNIDTHVFGNQGSMENLDGLQRFMNWKYNSHVQNVIRHLNNRMIYDPLLIEAIDVENPDAGMHIRLTALGSELLRAGKITMQGMIHQLDLVDVTGTMLKDVQFDMDLAMRMSGAADQMMGQATRDKRTLGEVSRVGHEGSMRMAMHAIMMDVQGMRPLALRWCSNRQQYTDEEQFVRIAGQYIPVKPGDLYGNYDYIPKTGPEPPEPGEMAKLMMDTAMLIGKDPALLSLPDKDGKVLDIHAFIKEGLTDQNVKNPDDFYRFMGGQPGQVPPGANVQVLPDEQIQQMREAGNVIPMRPAA